LDCLEGIKPQPNGGYKAICPAHDDHDPSLSVDEGNNGGAVLKCHAGCKAEEVVSAIGLTMHDLFPPKDKGQGGGKKRGKRRHTATWAIRDRERDVVAHHRRYDYDNGDKDCEWYQADNRTSGLNGTPLKSLPLYGSEDVCDWQIGARVVLCEGEPARDALAKSGFKAVATVTGANTQPSPEALRVLEGFNVYIWPDNDNQGRKHMHGVARDLQGIAGELRWFEWQDAPHKGDAADHPAIMSCDSESLNELRRQLTDAPVWEDTEAPPPDESETERQGQGKPETPTHDELRDRLLAQNPNLAYGIGGWQRYADGVWSPVAEAEVKGLTSHVLEAAKSERVKPTLSLVNSVAGLAQFRAFVPDRLWNGDPEVLVCANGALHIPTGELRPHSKEHYATSAVPYDYDPEAKAPFWRLLLNSSAYEVKDFLQEFAGYALTTDTSLETAVWLYGPPGSGKSSFLTGLETMLGARAGTLGLADIERTHFGLAGIAGKTLLTAAEQPSAFMRSTHTINQLISGEKIRVEQKYRDGYDLIPRVKLAWAMNELPRVGDANSGIFRRVKVVSFPAIHPDERRPEVKAGIAHEGPGILNWALEGLRRLRERGGFDIPEAVDTATENFRESNDVVAVFVGDRCDTSDPDAFEKSSTLYQEYKYWCQENGHHALSSTRMSEEWKRVGFERYRVRGKTRYKGVRLRLPSE